MEGVFEDPEEEGRHREKAEWWEEVDAEEDEEEN